MQGVQKNVLFFQTEKVNFYLFFFENCGFAKKIDSKVKKFRWLDQPSNGFDGWICGADSNDPWGRFEGQMD